MQALTPIDWNELDSVIGGNGANKQPTKEPEQSDRDTVSGNGNVTLDGIGALSGAYSHSQSDRNACIRIMRDTLCGPRMRGGGNLLGPPTRIQPSPEECTSSLNKVCGDPPRP